MKIKTFVLALFCCVVSMVIPSANAASDPQAKLDDQQLSQIVGAISANLPIEMSPGMVWKTVDCKGDAMVLGVDLDSKKMGTSVEEMKAEFNKMTQKEFNEICGKEFQQFKALTGKNICVKFNFGDGTSKEFLVQ